MPEFLRIPPKMPLIFRQREWFSSSCPTFYLKIYTVSFISSLSFIIWKLSLSCSSSRMYSQYLIAFLSCFKLSSFILFTRESRNTAFPYIKYCFSLKMQRFVPSKATPLLIASIDDILIFSLTFPFLTQLSTLSKKWTQMQSFVLNSQSALRISSVLEKKQIQGQQMSGKRGSNSWNSISQSATSGRGPFLSKMNPQLSFEEKALNFNIYIYIKYHTTTK